MLSSSATSERLIVGLAQMAPVWLQRQPTLAKMAGYVEQAAAAGCRLVAFGEALLPGYPFWIERTDGARFESPMHKEIHAHYMDQAVQVEAGHLDDLCGLAADRKIWIVAGVIERPADRGGHSLYASLVFIDDGGAIRSAHRKLMPTHEERLAWSPGDGHGLRVHSLGRFTLGGLNCWENWMPLPRAALYGQGEDLHVAAWPGSRRNTTDITRFIAREGRSYVLSVSGLMRRQDIPAGLPHGEALAAAAEEVMADGGSCVAGPDGAWLVEPCVGQETLLVAEIDHARVRAERQSFDPAGHYSRPDVTRLTVDRRRQATVEMVDGGRDDAEQAGRAKVPPTGMSG